MKHGGNTDDRALSERVDAAFGAVAEAVIERARRTQTPVVVWADGQIKEIPCEQFALPGEVGGESPTGYSNRRSNDNGAE